MTSLSFNESQTEYLTPTSQNSSIFGVIKTTVSDKRHLTCIDMSS